MLIGRQRFLCQLFAALCLMAGKAAFALQIEPGIGLGVEYTDNARLTQQDQLDDLIAATYVGARLSEDEGSLKYDATTTFNKHNYTQDSYEDQRYFYLGLNSDWEMVKNRFNWLLSNYFRQVPVVSVNSNTPDNIQDSNEFSFGANIDFPLIHTMPHCSILGGHFGGPFLGWLLW